MRHAEKKPLNDCSKYVTVDHVHHHLNGLTTRYQILYTYRLLIITISSFHNTRPYQANLL